MSNNNYLDGGGSRPPFKQGSERSSDAIAIGSSQKYPLIDSDKPQSDSLSHFKKPRVDHDNNNNKSFLNSSSPYPPMMTSSVHKGPTGIFFKTRLCLKFMQGLCRNGDACNFAHGDADLRRPPTNWKELVGPAGGSREENDKQDHWEEDQRIILRMKLCKKFCSGEGCPFGERCNFIHTHPAQFRESAVRSRDSTVISIGSTGSAVEPTMVDNAAGTGVMKLYRKTKICSKWETGQCPYVDKCHFAHGLAELNMTIARSEGETGTWGRPRALPVAEDNPGKMVNVRPASEKGEERRRLFRSKVPRKINTIYGDWLDSEPNGPRLDN
ncbi:hypothetical protein ACFE04_000148 [Oxalis oulophora]